MADWKPEGLEDVYNEWRRNYPDEAELVPDVSTFLLSLPADPVGCAQNLVASSTGGVLCVAEVIRGRNLWLMYDLDVNKKVISALILDRAWPAWPFL